MADWLTFEQNHAKLKKITFNPLLMYSFWPLIKVTVTEKLPDFFDFNITIIIS